MTTEVNLGEYQLFDKGYKVYRQDWKARVLVQDTDGQWFNAYDRDGAMFSPVRRSYQHVVGSLAYVQDLCARFDNPESALMAPEWEC